MHIRATAKGTRLLQKGRELRIQSLAANLGRLSQAELANLANAVEILNSVLREWS